MKTTRQLEEIRAITATLNEQALAHTRAAQATDDIDEKMRLLNAAIEASARSAKLTASCFSRELAPAIERELMGKWEPVVTEMKKALELMEKRRAEN